MAVDEFVQDLYPFSASVENHSTGQFDLDDQFAYDEECCRNSRSSSSSSSNSTMLAGRQEVGVLEKLKTLHLNKVSFPPATTLVLRI